MNLELNGIIPIDKPEGMTAAEVVRRVKRLSGVNKVGHTGTLDPFAAGLMLCCLGQATRLAQFLLHSTKQYQAVMVLGMETDTQDRTGQCTANSTYDHVTESAVESVFHGFTGKMMQIPPIYSALKHKGVPLYRLAREGKPIRKEARPIEIFQLRLQAFNLPEIHFQVECSAGTYIRTLAADIGHELGSGAYLKELRRTACGYFMIEEAVSLVSLEGIAESGLEQDRQKLIRHIIRPADALRGFSEYLVEGELEARIRQGVPLTEKDVPFWADGTLGNGFIRLVNGRRDLLAVIRRCPPDKYQYSCVFNY